MSVSAKAPGSGRTVGTDPEARSRGDGWGLGLRRALSLLLPMIIVTGGVAFALWLATADADELLAASRWCYAAAGVFAVIALVVALVTMRTGDDHRGGGPGEPGPDPLTPAPDGDVFTDWDAELRRLLHQSSPTSTAPWDV